jgi:putative hemolysin
MQGLILLSIVCVNGLISLSEMALVSSRKVRLQRMVDEGRRGADIALAMSESPTRFLASVQICLTVLGIMAGAHSGATLADDIERWVVAAMPSLTRWGHPIGVAFIIAFDTFLMVFLGELLPKRLALLAPESIAVRMAPTMRRLGLTLSPFANLLGRMTDTVLNRLPIKNFPDEQQTVTEDEFKLLITQGAEEGMLDRHEESMIKRVLQFGDITAEDLMTPRTKLVGLDLADSAEANIEKMLASNHASFPVYRGSIDNLVGIVSVKKVLEQYYELDKLDLAQCMTEPLFLPNSARVIRVLESMKKRGTHMAVLIDEFGGMAGVVTATDIVESVMGEVPGDGGETTQKFVTRTDGSILIDGMVSLFDLKERLQIDLDEFSDVSQTLSGLVMHVGKSIPKEGQSVLCKDWKFEVVDMDGNRIDKVLASRQELQVVIPEGLTHENSHSR